MQTKTCFILYSIVSRNFLFNYMESPRLYQVYFQTQDSEHFLFCFNANTARQGRLQQTIQKKVLCFFCVMTSAIEVD
jgi:hypothetical protein